jgi:hypothetical protein
VECENKYSTTTSESDVCTKEKLIVTDEDSSEKVWILSTNFGLAEYDFNVEEYNTIESGGIADRTLWLQVFLCMTTINGAISTGKAPGISTLNAWFVYQECMYCTGEVFAAKRRRRE